MSGGATPDSRCRLSMLAGFRQSDVMRQQSCRAGLSLFTRVDLATE